MDGTRAGEMTDAQLHGIVAGGAAAPYIKIGLTKLVRPLPTFRVGVRGYVRDRFNDRPMIVAK